MPNEQNWMEKMMQENADLDRLEEDGFDLEKSTEGNPEDVQNHQTIPQTTDDESAQTETSPIDLDKLVPSNTPPAPAPSNDEVKALQEQIANLQAELQRNRSENGRAHALADKIRELEAENQAFRDQLSEQRRVKPYEGRVDEFSQEECDFMSDEMRTLLGGRLAALQKQNEALAERQRQIDESLARATRMAADNERTILQKQLTMRFPNLATIAASDAWKTFCAETDPITRQPFGALFKDSIGRCDADAAGEIINRFISVSGMNGGRMQVGLKPEEQSSASGNATTMQTSNKTYPLDEVTNFLNKVYSGGLNLKDPKVAQRYREYEAAMAEDRVVG